MDRDFSIRFSTLPFEPENNQVLYIENEFDEEANLFINEYYDDICRIFQNYGKEFYYLPKLGTDKLLKKKICYYVPYLSAKILDQGLLSSTYLLDYMTRKENRTKIQPSVLYYSERINGEWSLGGKVLDIARYRSETLPAAAFVLDIIEVINIVKDFDNHRFKLDKPAFSKQKDLSYLDFSLNTECYAGKVNGHTEKQEDDKVVQIVDELREKVRELRLYGVPLMVIHNLIDDQEPLSKIVITPDYRIFLPDYNNIEIEMGALPKSIYFLFLRYTSGILFKHLTEHKDELFRIYKQLRPETNDKILYATIDKVTDPLLNAINENVARIRKAFVEKFDERLAKNYIISGNKGSEHFIPLDRNLVEWQE